MNTSGAVVGRQDHLPFGEDFGESGTRDKHHFTSYERDTEVGTDYGINRQYSLNSGRFMRPDPVERWKDKPQSLNRYSYVQNDPVNLTDPLGLYTVPFQSTDNPPCPAAILHFSWSGNAPDYWECPDDTSRSDGSSSGGAQEKPPKADCGDFVDKDLDLIDEFIAIAKAHVHGVQVGLLEFATNPENREVDPAGNEILESLNELLDRFVYNPQDYPGPTVAPWKVTERFKELGRSIVGYLQPSRTHGARQQEIIGIIGSFARGGLKSLDLIGGRESSLSTCKLSKAQNDRFKRQIPTLNALQNTFVPLLNALSRRGM